MSRQRHAAAVAIVSVVLVFSSAWLGAQTTFVAVSRGGHALETTLPQGNSVGVIVEFTDPPLFAPATLRSAASIDRAAPARTLHARFAQFADDLRAISTASAKSLKAAPRAPLITHTYERLFAGASATVPAEAVPAIEKLPYVAHVYPDRQKEALGADRTANVALADSVAKIKADQVWRDFGTRGEGVVVAVIDTGIDYKHPSLGGSFGPGSRVTGGWDFVNKDADPMDDNGHGTHVAGIIGGNSDPVVGVAPGVTFLAYKVLSAGGSGPDSDVLAGVERAADPNQDGDPSDHADVVNMSLGGFGVADDPLPRAIETASANGVLFAIASGNSGGFYTVSSPAIAASAIAVGATDVLDRMASFTSGGPDPVSLAIKPEICAPGVSILSAVPGGGSATKSGTSMATPHVAGVAALIKAVHRDWTAREIKSAMISTAEKLDADVMAQGAGRVDALRAAAAAITAEPPVISLGRAALEADTWNTAGDVRLTNHSLAPVNVSTTVTGATSAVAVTVDPPSLQLEPGASATVTVAVAVDHTNLPFPTTGSLAVAGDVVLTGGPALVRIPWAFVKALRMTVKYDRNDPFTALVGGTTASSMRPVMRDGRDHVDIYEPPGDYDILMNVISLSAEVKERFLLMPRRSISTDAEVDFSSATPVTTITYAAEGPQGTHLSDIGRAPGKCLHSFIIALPADSNIGFTGIVAPISDGKSFTMQVSAVPAGVSIAGSETCWGGGPSVYVAQFGDIPTSGTAAEVTVETASWQKVPIGVVVPAGLKNQRMQLGGALLYKPEQFAMPLPEYLTIPISGEAWRGTLYMTPERHDTMVTSGFVRQTADFAGVIGYPVIDVRSIRSTDGGIVLTPSRTNGPADYVGKPDEVLLFGEGIAYPQSGILADQGTLSASLGWVGSLGEYRPFESQSTSITLRDATGKALASGTSALRIPLPGEGEYEMEAKKRFATGVYATEAVVTSRIDSRREDGVAPSFRCLRLVDGNGSIDATPVLGGAAAIRFAAIDLVFDKVSRQGSYALVPPEKVTVQWRPHGVAEWQPVTVAVEAEEIANNQEEYEALGHVPAGTLFRADLSPATAARGPVDLRLHIEDAAGNWTEYVIAPALISGAERRRPAGH